MPELDGLFISSHAVEQFQSRIAPMTDERARFFIREGIRLSTNIKLLPDGGTLRVRTRRPFPFEFRAFCVFDAARQNWVVATVLRGGYSVTRKRQHRDAAAQAEGGVGFSGEEVCEKPQTIPNPC
jgi:hypothetical protein